MIKKLNEKEYELLKAELKRLQQEVDLLYKQQAREVALPLHLALVISVSEDGNRAIVTTSKRTLIEVPLGYRIKDTVKPNMVVGLSRIGLSAVKEVEMTADEFNTIVIRGKKDE